MKEQLQAENIYKELKSPKKPLKFSEGARKYSTDAQSSGNGGEVDYKLEASIQKDVLDNLKNLKKDEISKPFLSGNDWYIVKFFDIKKSKPNGSPLRWKTLQGLVLAVSLKVPRNKEIFLKVFKNLNMNQ